MAQPNPFEGMDDSAIAAMMAQLQQLMTQSAPTIQPGNNLSGGATAPIPSTGGGDIDSLLAGLGSITKPRDSQEQVDFENKLAVIDGLISALGNRTPQQITQLAGTSGNIPAYDGTNSFAMGLNADAIMRQRNRKDALFARDNLTAPAQAPNPDVMAMLTSLLGGGQQAPAAPEAPSTGYEPTVADRVNQSDARNAAGGVKDLVMTLLGGMGRPPVAPNMQPQQGPPDRNAGNPLDFLSSIFSPSLPRGPF